jgi:FG-GAP-like repeat
MIYKGELEMRNEIFSLVKCVSSAVICCLVLTISVAAQTINLQLQSDYTLGTGSPTPRFAVGDLNNDGKPDIVTSTGIAGQPISVLLNTGSGSFAAPSTFGAALNAGVVAIGDFNNDGNADLAVGSTNNTTGVLNIRLGNGTGGFPNETNTTVVQNVTDLAAADFNGDGNLDLAMINSLGYSTAPTNAVRLMLGNGAGGFGLPTSFAVGSQPLDLEITDLNADGRPDIAVVAFATANTVSILLNNGTGGFTAAPGISWANATSAAKIVAADFNRDCATDLAVIRSDSVAILQGSNTGNFSLTSITVSNAPISLAAGDFNLDHKTDLAIGRLSAAGGNGFIILPGNGAAGFGAAFSLNSSLIPDNLAVLDVNMDGKTDVALSRRTNNFSLYSGSSALFSRTENDFDTDGRTDLSVFRPSVGDWFLQRSTQGFLAAHWGISSDKPVPADYDGDFKTDIAVWRENGYGDPDRSYFFILQSSNNTFRQEQFGRVGDIPAVAGDWDGDGKADVAVYRSGAGAGEQSFFFYRPSATAGVDFRPVWWGISGDQPVRGDFDGDGRLDPAVFRQSDATWYILQSSNGQPLYQSWGLASDRRVPADYDGDGKTDFAVFRPTDGVWYILGSQTGTPSYRQWGLSSDVLTPGDFNGDGKAEAAVYRPSEQRWYIPPCAVFNGINTKFGTSGDAAVTTAP